MRKKAPRRASFDEVKIIREGETAVIEHADPNVSVARVNVGSQLQTMSDAAVLDLFNAMMDAQENLAAKFDSTAVEIPPGKPQVRFVEDSAQWVPRGRVLRCHIEDYENGETVIYIDDREFSLTEFGGLLRFFPGGACASPSLPKTRSRSSPRSRCVSRRTRGCPFHLFHRASQRRLGSPARTSF